MAGANLGHGWLVRLSMAVLWCAGSLSCGNAPTPKPDPKATPPHTADTSSTVDSGTRTTDPPTTKPNFLLLVSDDQGVDWVRAYGDHGDTEPRTPNVDSIASEGMLFERAYASPTCSPGRATLLTGRYGFRYGIGAFIPGSERFELDMSETLLPTVLEAPEHGATTALLGKWHLGSKSMTGIDQPLEMGLDLFAGSFTGVWDYYDWTRIENGIESTRTEYATTVTADAAIDAISTLPEPWFIMVAFNAPHAPFHSPPEALHSYTLDDTSTDTELFAAAVEALDTEVGRILEGLSVDQRTRTYVAYLSDNGSMNQVLQPPEVFGGKNSVRETGVRVPLLLRGPGISPGSTTDAMVQTVDILPTFLDLAQVALPAELELDGESFREVLADPSLPARTHVYTEQFTPNGPGPYTLHRRAVRNERYKLIRSQAEPDALYDLDGLTREADPLPQPYTPAEQAAFEELEGVILTLEAEAPPAP